MMKTLLKHKIEHGLSSEPALSLRIAGALPQVDGSPREDNVGIRGIYTVPVYYIYMYIYILCIFIYIYIHMILLYHMTYIYNGFVSQMEGCNGISKPRKM